MSCWGGMQLSPISTYQSGRSGLRNVILLADVHDIPLPKSERRSNAGINTSVFTAITLSNSHHIRLLSPRFNGVRADA